MLRMCLVLCTTLCLAMPADARGLLKGRLFGRAGGCGGGEASSGVASGYGCGGGAATTYQVAPAQVVIPQAPQVVVPQAQEEFPLPRTQVAPVIIAAPPIRQTTTIRQSPRRLFIRARN